MTILDIAREQVLERGIGLDEAQTLAVLRLPDERVDEALSLARDAHTRALQLALPRWIDEAAATAARCH